MTIFSYGLTLFPVIVLLYAILTYFQIEQNGLKSLSFLPPAITLIIALLFLYLFWYR